TSFTVTFAPAALGTRSAAIHIASNDANENPFDISLTGNGLDPNLNVAVGIDLPGTPITPGGQAPWVWQSTTTHDGISAGQSGVISDNQSSAFTLTAAGPGTVSFWWKVSSVYGYDFLSFSIDGVEQSGKISGEVDWRQKSYSLTAGSHTLQWSYTKDNVGSFGADCGWVDQVSFVATGISPVVTSPTSASITGTTATLGGNVTSDGGPTVTARGVVYAPTATTSNPRLGGTGVTNVPGTGTTGVITVPVSGLTPGTAYTFAAYATNSIGTSYSVTGSFTTLSNNDNLSNLALSSGTLSPAFASGTLAYSTGVSNASASLTVTPTAAQANAIIMVNGTSVASGSASSPVSLSVGTNTITVLVTAQDGTTSQFYTITVTRAAGASTGYAAWIGNYPGLADATASGDPDHDGIPNLLEYVLNGNPGAASTAILPVVSKVAGNFVFTFSRRVASAQDTTQIFQYSSDLSHWTDVLITSPTDTRVALGTADANGIQSVTVTILAGTNASMFGRLQVTSIDQVVSGYAAWIATYPGLVDATASGDPDHDGIPNLLEYVLNGNPGIASSAILPSVTKVANNFVFTFSRRVVSEQDTTQIFQYSSDLSHWTDVSITGTKGTEVALGSADGAGVQPVTVTIPQGASPTMFGRLKVMQP
ncbi:MAG: cadherin-like beta sandwich domain-containing protein, partial [Verrucomicrobiota bacterium]